MAKRNKKSINDSRNKNKNDKGIDPKQKFQEDRQRSVIPLHAKSANQRKTLKAFTSKQVVIQTGSAGVGKTLCMCWWAAKLWLQGDIDNILITRPHKHLGEDYGAVKGNDAEKLLPFCMSILAHLKKYLGTGILKNNFRMDGFEDLFSDVRGIQIVPIEKIQGRSFDNKTIILADEIQNASIAQVKSLTTRMEEGCQLLISGDPRQTAIGNNNGLNFLENIVNKYPHPSIETIQYTNEDSCRKGVSAHLVRAYEEIGEW